MSSNNSDKQRIKELEDKVRELEEKLNTTVEKVLDNSIYVVKTLLILERILPFLPVHTSNDSDPNSSLKHVEPE